MSEVTTRGKHYRNTVGIIVDILTLLLPGPMSRTHVMYRAFLSYAQLEQYGGTLAENGLIQIDKDRLWWITGKGCEFLKRQGHAMELFDAIRMKA